MGLVTHIAKSRISTTCETQNNWTRYLLFVGIAVFRLYWLSCFFIGRRGGRVRRCRLSTWWQLRNCKKYRDWVRRRNKVELTYGRGLFATRRTDLKEDARCLEASCRSKTSRNKRKYSILLVKFHHKVTQLSNDKSNFLKIYKMF